MSNILITGVGSYLPKKVISNNELPSNLDTNDEWIKKRTGIKQRYLVSKDELTSTMAIAASKKALQNANIDSKEIDLIIVATTTPDQTFPATAVKVQSELDIDIGPAFGMIGTLIGLVFMLNSMDGGADGASKIGPAMGVALVTTFYGSLFSSLIFNPFAEKLQLRNRENRQASELMIAGLLLIWQKKHPLDVSDMLTSYIEPKDRLKYFSDQD